MKKELPLKRWEVITFQVTMTKKLKPVESWSPKFRGYLAPECWTLCVGAGISRGIAPNWIDLTRLVVNETFNAKISESEFKNIVQEYGWSLDSWIQAAANKCLNDGKNIEDFNNLIESHLYQKIREKANGLGLEKYLTKVLNHPRSAPKQSIIDVCDFIEETFPNCSLLQVGKFLIDAAKANKSPVSVLTFNADTFLETYIDLFLRREHYKGPGTHGHPIYYFVSITHPISTGGNKIPIIHCHGSISPQFSDDKKPYDSRHRLVFLEDEYLSTNSSGASWPETVFHYHAQSTKLAFVGMSMSDSNIRRWMNSIKQEKQKDSVIHKGSHNQINPEHIWVNPKPKSKSKQELLLVSQIHLGVRPAWIKEWGSLGNSLNNLASI